MRIGTKLFLTYLILVSLFAAGSWLGLPRLVHRIVMDVEQQRLDKDVQWMTDSVNRLLRSRRGSPPLPQYALASLAEFLVAEEDTIALVDVKGMVLRSNQPALEGQVVPLRVRVSRGPWRRSPAIEVGGQLVLVSSQPLAQGEGPMAGLSIVMMRDVNRIENLATPITRTLIPLLAVTMIVALAVAGYVSREMAKRLQSTGEAARALAEGDLSQRAPTRGRDEITELAHHFNHMAERIEALVAGLRRSEQSRKDLLVTVSHELRTPLTSIQGFAEALRDGVVQGEDRRRRYYEIIAGESARLTRLINDVFDVAKLEAGQVDLKLRAIGVASWLVSRADSLAPIAAAAGARLEVEISPEAERARIHADADRLGQVLGNLVSNAVRYTPPGEAVTIEALIEGDDVVILVADRGPGLAPEDVDHVFERFYQGANKGDHKGTGLGLAIVKSTVEAHGGTVGVRSEPGQGATFWFRLKRYTE